MPGSAPRTHDAECGAPATAARPDYPANPWRAAVPSSRVSSPAVRPPRGEACTRRTGTSTSSSTPICTSGTRVPRTGSRGKSSTPRAGSSASTPTWASARAETHWPLEKFMKYSEEDFDKDVFEAGISTRAVLQSTYLKAWYPEGSTQPSATRGWSRSIPDKLIVNGRFDRARARPGSSSSRRTPSVTTSGRQGLHRRVVQGLARLEADRSRGADVPGKCKELGIKNIHAHKGPTIWPLDKDAFDVKDIDIAATSNPELNFIVEHVGRRGSRTSASWPPRSPTCTPAWPW